jgi:hypothetical protein
MPGKEIKGRSKIANYRDGGRIGFKEGMGAGKRRKTPKPDKLPAPRPDKILKKPPSPHLEPPKGGRRPGPSKGPSPKKKFKVEEDWAAKGGRIK